MATPGSQATPVGNNPVNLDRATAEAFAETHKYVRTMMKGREAGAGPMTGGVNPGHLATANAAIASGTATTPTSGTVTFRTWDGTTIGADTGNTATAFNYHDKTIASGSLVFLAWALGAWWIIDVRSCTNLS
jgi:hypothetical protein